MATKKGTLRTCGKGHQYFKSSDCPVCPYCEKERKPQRGFLSVLAAPARRALETKGISTPRQLSKYTEKEILSFHGMGKSSIPVLREVLSINGLSFKD